MYSTILKKIKPQLCFFLKNFSSSYKIPPHFGQVGLYITIQDKMTTLDRLKNRMTVNRKQINNPKISGKLFKG